MAEDPLTFLLDDGWRQLLDQELQQPYFRALMQFVEEERKQHRVFPQPEQIFEAFNQTPPGKVKVVLLGQDPYHGPGQAHGLCFSVNQGVALPPSLRNIYRELAADLDIEPAWHGNLSQWARQGVLLLNATLTVRANLAGSHQKKGWETFTDKVISILSDKRKGLVFLLWGNHARAKQQLIDCSRHHVLLAAHPSPLSASRGFLGCRHFSRANQLLLEGGHQQIDWRLS